MFVFALAVPSFKTKTSCFLSFRFKSACNQPPHHHTRVSHSFCNLQSYTQYIPLSIHQLKEWAGAPAIFVLDCSAAGVLLEFFIEPLSPQDDDGGINPDTPPQRGGGPGGVSSRSDGGAPSENSEKNLLLVKPSWVVWHSTFKRVIYDTKYLVNNTIHKGVLYRQR